LLLSSESGITITLTGRRDQQDLGLKQAT
jgi:hypothetical protein